MPDTNEAGQVAETGNAKAVPVCGLTAGCTNETIQDDILTGNLERKEHGISSDGVTMRYSMEPVTVSGCEDCIQDKTQVCEQCEDVTAVCSYFTDVHTGRRTTESWCEDCVNENTYTCSDCDDIFDQDNTTGVSYGSGIVCDYCYSENYSSCNDCGDAVHNDDIVCVDDDDYCSRCAPDHSDGRGSNNRTISPKLDTFVIASANVWDTTNPLPAGTELECEDGNFQKADAGMAWETNGVGVTSDGSLSNGAEFLTPPAHGADLKRVITETTDTLTKAGYEVHKSCGTHIHIGVKGLEKSPNIVRVLEVYHALEPLMYALVSRDRRTNSFCHPIQNNYPVLSDGSVNVKTPEQLEAYLYFGRNTDRTNPADHTARDREDIANSKRNKCGAASRYCWLNMHSIFYRGTIEFRLHQGTLNAKKLLTWIRLHQFILESIRAGKWEIRNVVQFREQCAKINNPDKAQRIGYAQECLKSLADKIEFPPTFAGYLSKRIIALNK